MSKQRTAVTLHVTLVAPPAGVAFALQDKDNLLYDKIVSGGGDVSFDVSVEVDEAGRAYGKFAMGTPVQRFFYICCGTSAGQFGSPWTRRINVPLSGLPAGTSLSGAIQGTAKDGGPACATVPLLYGGWKATGS